MVGVEDGSFVAFQRRGEQKCPLCMVKMRGTKVEDIRLSLISVDGVDATPKLSAMLRNTCFDVIILGGITFAGFNIVDAPQLFKEFCQPIIIFMRDKPRQSAMRGALKSHFKDWADRWKCVESLGHAYSTSTRVNQPPIYFEVVGANPDWAENILKQSALLCRIPEPVRLARLIARGLSSTGG